MALGYLNKVCSGDRFDYLVDDFKRMLPSTIVRDTLYDSLLDLAGERLTKQRLFDTCWRLAGNVRRLAHRKPVPPWNRQTEMEWVPVQILGAKRKQVGRFNRGWQYRFQVLAGTCCPMVLTRFWSQKFCSYISRFIGFSRPPSINSSKPVVRLYRHPMELVGCRLNVLIDPTLSVTEPVFNKTGISPQHFDWNRELLKYRDRLEKGYECCRGFGRNVKCYLCPIGWAECPAGTHRLNYSFSYCPRCSVEKAPFDDEVSTEICINCYEQKAVEG